MELRLQKPGKLKAQLQLSRNKQHKNCKNVNHVAACIKIIKITAKWAVDFRKNEPHAWKTLEKDVQIIKYTAEI